MATDAGGSKATDRTLERRSTARAYVRTALGRLRHILGFRAWERIGLCRHRMRVRRVRISKILEIRRKNPRPTDENVEMFGTDDDRDLIARYNARQEASGMAAIHRSVAKVREAARKIFRSG